LTTISSIERAPAGADRRLLDLRLDLDRIRGGRRVLEPEARLADQDLVPVGKQAAGDGRVVDLRPVPAVQVDDVVVRALQEDLRVLARDLDVLRDSAVDPGGSPEDEGLREGIGLPLELARQKAQLRGRRAHGRSLISLVMPR